MKPHLHTLDNGLRTLFIDTKSFPTLTTILLVGAGSRYENEKNNGVAHFFEHMAFKGSKKYPTSLIISSLIDSLGGYFNAFTSKDHTGYWIKSTNNHFEKVVDVISDMIRRPLLLDDEIEREKGVIAEEINMYEDTPMYKVGDLFEELMYGGSPLGFDIAGTKKTVSSFTRSTFVDYMENLYHPMNSVLVVAGGFDGGKQAKNRKDYIRIVEEKFRGWKNGKKKAEFFPVVEKQTKPKILIRHKKTEQSHFCLGFRAYNLSDRRKYALFVLATILGGGMSSRLFTQVRERRGLCYYIRTGRQAYSDVGNMVTSAGVANNIEKTKDAIKVTLAEHRKIMKGDVSKEELQKAKDLVCGRTMLSLEDSYNVATFFGHRAILENSTESPEKLVKEIAGVTADEVVDAARDVFKSEKLNFVMIGPLEKTDISESDLEF